MQANEQPGPAGARDRPPALHDEEETGRQSTPRKDLASAAAIAVFAAAVMLLSTRLETPDRWYTSPGLLPFVTAAALLVMAASLGWQALRNGAARHLRQDLAAAVRRLAISDEDRRAVLLAAIVVAYVLLVARVGFELRFATERLELVFTGYELISILTITTVLRLFWRASLSRCFLVAICGVEGLAWAFRYGLNMIMPEAF